MASRTLTHTQSHCFSGQQRRKKKSIENTIHEPQNHDPTVFSLTESTEKLPTSTHCPALTPSFFLFRGGEKGGADRMWRARARSLNESLIFSQGNGCL
jgi:hypothetical protein